MIQKEIGEILGDCEEDLQRAPWHYGVYFNYRVSGIVKSMFRDAFKVSLVYELIVAKASGYETIILFPGGSTKGHFCATLLLLNIR